MSANYTVIEGAYLRDILDQPAAIERTVRSFEESLELKELGARLRHGSYRRLVLTGMGSSFHALHPLYVQLSTAGMPVTMVETSELIHYHPGLLSPDTVVIAVSQSGRSAEMVRMLELNAGRSRVVAVTNDADSLLAARADTVIRTRAGKEHTVSSKTYVTALAALAWLGGHLCDADMHTLRRELAPLSDAVAAYLDHWRDHVRRAGSQLDGVERLYFVGRGPSLATAGTAGLTTKESTRFPAEGMSAAAFRHGPIEMSGQRLFLLVFEGEARTAELNHRLARDVSAAGGRAAIVCESMDRGLFYTPPLPPGLRTVVEILPVQMMTLALAAMAGFEAGAFTVATKVTATE